MINQLVSPPAIHLDHRLPTVFRKRRPKTSWIASMSRSMLSVCKNKQRRVGWEMEERWKMYVSWMKNVDYERFEKSLKKLRS